MWAETTLGEFAISLVLVILCEPVKVESESRNFSKSSMFTGGNKNNNQDSLFKYSCQGTSPFSLMGNQTVHEDSFK